MKIKLTIDERILPGVLAAMRVLADEMEANMGTEAGRILANKACLGCHPENVRMLRAARQRFIDERDDQTSARDLRIAERSERILCG
jgi:hypothetical protein